MQGSIARHLQLSVAVPLVAVVGFAGLALFGSVREVRAVGDFGELVDLSAKAGAVVREMQVERAAAAVELTENDETARSAFVAQVARTDAVIAEFRRGSAVKSRASLRAIDSGFEALAEVREQVRESPAASLSAIAFNYRIVIADLLAFRESLALETSPLIAGEIRAAATVAQANEALGQLQIVVVRTLADGELTPEAQQESAADRARFSEAADEFREVAEPAWVGRWEQASATEKAVEAQRLEDQLGRTTPGSPLKLDVTDWVTSIDGWIVELYGIQRLVDAAVADDVATARRAQMRDAAAQIGGVFVVLTVTALLTGAVARRITRRLRVLRNAATNAAYERLPDAVRRLNAAPPGMVNPDEAADQAVADFAIGGHDEIAEVGGALRSLHHEAVRIAGEQAMMRARVAEMFVHLSRREQRLVDAMLSVVDEVEKDETDPDRLQQLYQLDHLATRMARINRSLLVLGGSGVARVRQRSTMLINVVQAAQSQIEHYTRVRIGEVAGGLAVAGQAVDEIVHLIAELLDNATAYSPPERDVWVTGYAEAGYAIVVVIDEGVGLSLARRDSFNAQLGNSAEADFTAVRSMGLTVVGRLAVRYGVRVRLDAGSPSGTVAQVVLPPTILTDEVSPVVPPPGRVVHDSAVPLFRPAAPAAVTAMIDAGVDHSAVQPALFAVNGWFKTVFDGASAAVRWPQVTDPGEAGLPRRVPQAPSFPDRSQTAAVQPVKFDPATVAGAMAAFAKGVASRRPGSSRPSSSPTGAQQ